MQQSKTALDQGYAITQSKMIKQVCFSISLSLSFWYVATPVVSVNCSFCPNDVAQNLVVPASKGLFCRRVGSSSLVEMTSKIAQCLGDSWRYPSYHHPIPSSHPITWTPEPCVQGLPPSGQDGDASSDTGARAEPAGVTQTLTSHRVHFQSIHKILYVNSCLDGL